MNVLKILNNISTHDLISSMFSVVNICLTLYGMMNHTSIHSELNV